MQIVISTKRGTPTPNYKTVSNIETNIYPIEVSDTSTLYPSAVFMNLTDYPIQFANTDFTTVLSKTTATYPTSIESIYIPTVLSKTTATYPISISKS